jgi:glycosyltransferase involved in cell wall biosynthesis
MKYKILIFSPVPAFESGGVFRTIDLWARDLEAQCAISTVHLICPVQSGCDGTVINPEIAAYRQEVLSDKDLIDVVSKVDVVQLAIGGWRSSSIARRLLKISRRLQRIVILGVSSNRAKSAWLNSSNKLIGAIRYLEIRSAQSWFAFQADGVFVVGSGLKKLFQHINSNLHVGIASWIQETDIASPRSKHHSGLNICMASRIEKMKGMHIGVSAVGLVRTPHLRLSIIGDGPERSNIERQISDLGLSRLTTFQTTVAYPKPFLDLLRQADIVLLTNLSDEQPRLIFDALSQGCIPICPDTSAYRNLGLNRDILYKQGDVIGLSRTIQRLVDPELRAALSLEMLPLLKRFTIERMHASRSDWILQLMRRKATFSMQP